jgi:hypothetical protein
MYQGIRDKEWTKSVADLCDVVYAFRHSFAFPVYTHLPKRRKGQG